MTARPLPLGISGTPKNTQYYEFECTQCGKTAKNTYCAPIHAEMLEWLLCFSCHFWKNFEDKTVLSLTTIINGHVYAPGNRTEGEFRGMAGRRFDIEYIEPSVYAGQRCTTFDLWSGSQIPDRLRGKFPDTAMFLGGAQKEKVGDIGCWNASDPRNQVYPLPRQLKEAVRK
jgi:hypothetical protein